MNKKVLIISLIVLVVVILGIYQLTMAKSESTKVLLETNYGNITLKLRADMPITAGNFKSLVEKGTYDNIIFHRVIQGFMIQGGDPTGTGYGSSSIPNIPDEFLGKQQNNRGTIAMANAGPDTGGSQFFINAKANNFLDDKHTVFGKVTAGMDVVHSIEHTPVDDSDKPLTPVVIRNITMK